MIGSENAGLLYRDIDISPSLSDQVNNYNQYSASNIIQYLLLTVKISIILRN